MSPNEREYYRDRAASERARAAVASAVAAEIHLELACLYEKLVELDEQGRPTLTIVADRLSASPASSATLPNASRPSPPEARGLGSEMGGKLPLAAGR